MIECYEQVIIGYYDPIASQTWQDFTASIDWGFGVTSLAQLQPVGPANVNGITEVEVFADPSYVYNSPGDYVIKVNITGPHNIFDDQGNHNYGTALVTNTQVKVSRPSVFWSIGQANPAVPEGSQANYTLSLANSERPSLVLENGETATIRLTLADLTTDVADRQRLSESIQNAVANYNSTASTQAGDPNSADVNVISDEVVEITFYGDGVASFVLPFSLAALVDGDDAESAESFQIQLSEATGNSTLELVISTDDRVATSIESGEIVFSNPASVNWQEGSTGTVVIVAAANDTFSSDPIAFAITGGADSARFSLDSTTGALTFNQIPDFEQPIDANADNVYEVVVTATGASSASAQQVLAINVTNANEAPVITSPSSFDFAEGSSDPISIVAQDDDPLGLVTITLGDQKKGINVDDRLESGIGYLMHYTADPGRFTGTHQNHSTDLPYGSV